jgi:hypothetical protein
MIQEEQPAAGRSLGKGDVWDRDCTIAVGALLALGGAAAETHGQLELGEVCAVLGALCGAVGMGIWAAPRLRRRASAEPLGPRRPATPDQGGQEAPRSEEALPPSPRCRAA